jgi:CRISPR-associated endonuclease Csn1
MINDIDLVPQTVTVGIDMGTGSLAVVARRGESLVWQQSMLLVADTASLAERRGRRRMIRTRLAHRAREYWLNECARTVGLPLLKTVTRVNADTYKISAVDDRLKREHPPKNTPEICYNGALLRIMLIEGRIYEMEPWQIYKALHSAIQKRGYDNDVPWGRGYAVGGGDDEITDQDGDEVPVEISKDLPKEAKEAESTMAAVSEFEHYLKTHMPDPATHLPCYFEAMKSGLWSPEEGIISLRQNHKAEQRGLTDYKGYIASRKMIEQENRLILNATQKKYPALNPDYVLYGPSLVRYGSHPRHATLVKNKGGQGGLILGRESDWQGVLGQKLPRFDNRNVSSCALIPRFKAAKIPSSDLLKGMPKTDEEDIREVRLYPTFVLMMILKNLRVIKTLDGGAEPLTPDEARKLYEAFKPKLSFKKRELKTALNAMGFSLAPGSTDSLKAGGRSGRASFSKPALRMLTELLLEGWPPMEAKTRFLKNIVKSNTDPLRGLIATDLSWLDQIVTPDGRKAEWMDFYIPQVKSKQVSIAETGEGFDVDRFIGAIKYPVVRHRLWLLGRMLRKMRKDLKALDIDIQDARIGLEVIRDITAQSFLGEEAKKQLSAVQRQNEAENDAVGDMCEEYNLRGDGDFERVKLARRQKFIDPFAIDDSSPGDAAPIMMAGITSGLYDIEHIVPVALGGPNELYNKVLTHRKHNRDQKGNRTPYHWLHGGENWGTYLDKVKNLPERNGSSPGLSRLTKKLLTASDAEDLVSRKTDLQATSYMEKAAQQLIYGIFNWKSPLDGGKRHVVCVPGGITARLRRERDLDRLLYPKKEEKGAPAAPPSEPTTSPTAPLHVQRKRKAKRAEPAWVKARKNRENPKHHIVDAAVLTFVPEWALNPRKTDAVRLPDFASQRWFVSSVIEGHAPEIYNVTKPALFETRLSLNDAKTLVAVKKHIHGGTSPSVEWKFAELKKQVEKGMFNHPPGDKRPSPITLALAAALNDPSGKIVGPIKVKMGQHEILIKSLNQYAAYSAAHHKVMPDGGCIEGSAHKGLLIWRVNGEAKRSWQATPVAAWNSVERVKRELIDNADAEIEFWNSGKILQRGDFVEVTGSGVRVLQPGRYTVASTQANGQIAFQESAAKPSIAKLIEKGGFRVLPR